MNYSFKYNIQKIKKPELQIIIAIIGLLVTISNALIFCKYLENELSYDRFHENEDRIYRVLRVIYEDAEKNIRYKGAEYPLPLGPAIADYFTEVEYQTRLKDYKVTVMKDQLLFNEEVHFADADFFKIFSFPLIKSSSGEPLKNLSHVVISREMSEKYFAGDDPIGKTLYLKLGDVKKGFVVSGVADDIPENSTIQFDFLVNIENLTGFFQNRNLLQNWLGIWQVPVYVLTKDKASVNRINERFEAFTSQHFEEDLKMWRTKNDWKAESNPFGFSLQPLRKVHLGIGVYQGRGYAMILLFSVLILFTLLIASISYGNTLFISISKRIRVISLKKILGASSWEIKLSIFIESVLIVLVMLVFSLAVIESMGPAYKTIIGIDFTFGQFYTFPILMAMLAIVVVMGVLPALYPSYYIQKLISKNIVRSRHQLNYKNNFVKVLVVSQFVISVILIFSAVLIGKQIKVYASKDLGYNLENLLVVPTQSRDVEEISHILNLFRKESVSNPGILDVSSCHAAFGLSMAPSDDSEEFQCHYNAVDHNFIKTIGARIMLGNDFFESHSRSGYAIVNNKFVERYGLENPVGKKIYEALSKPEWIRDSVIRNSEIVGVVEDFTYAPLKYEMRPAIFYCSPHKYYSRLLFRISAENKEANIRFLEKIWEENIPETPFEYYYLKDKIESSYAVQSNLKNIIAVETFIAVIISIFSLLAFFSAIFASRMRGMVIRKVYGASLYDIIKNEIRLFIILALIANIIALPIAYYLLNRIFENFASRINFDFGVIAISFVISICIVFIVIVFNAYKTNRINVVKVLKVNE